MFRLNTIIKCFCFIIQKRVVLRFTYVCTTPSKNIKGKGEGDRQIACLGPRHSPFSYSHAAHLTQQLLVQLLTSRLDSSRSLPNRQVYALRVMPQHTQMGGRYAYVLLSYHCDGSSRIAPTRNCTHWVEYFSSPCGGL